MFAWLLSQLWYISLYSRKMTLYKNLSGKGRGWRGVVVVLAICSLALCLATRFSVLPTSHVHAVKTPDTRAGETKRQHMERDGAGLVALIATSSSAKLPIHHSDVIPSEPLHSREILNIIFYNRPPPSLSVFSL